VKREKQQSAEKQNCHEYQQISGMRKHVPFGLEILIKLKYLYYFE
jgi:hypothetical protein